MSYVRFSCPHFRNSHLTWGAPIAWWIHWYRVVVFDLLVEGQGNAWKLRTYKMRGNPIDFQARSCQSATTELPHSFEYSFVKISAVRKMKVRYQRHWDILQVRPPPFCMLIKVHPFQLHNAKRPWTPNCELQSPSTKLARHVQTEMHHMALFII